MTSTTPIPRDDLPSSGRSETSWRTALASSGASLVVVLAGLGAVLIIFVVAIGKMDQEPNVVAAASAAAGVIGTIVGAYFGMQVGSSGKEKLEAARAAEAVKVQHLAAAAPPDVAMAVLERFDRSLLE